MLVLRAAAGAGAQHRPTSLLLQCIIQQGLHAQPSSGNTAQHQCTTALTSGVLLDVGVLGYPGIWRTYAAEAAPAVSTEQDASSATQEDPTAAALRGVLARSLPAEDVKDMTKPDAMRVLRFGDLSATSELIDSFQSIQPPGQPLYDLPSWLATNYPRYDTRPKSPFYDWVSWVQQNLPAEQAQLYLVLDTHLQDPRKRAAMLRKAQFELACLWDWQHRRAALGLPLQPTPQEVEAAASEAAAAHQQAAAALMQEAEVADALAKTAAMSAGVTTGWRQSVDQAEAAYQQAHAMYLRTQAHFLTPNMEETVKLQSLQQASTHLRSKYASVQRCKKRIEALLKKHASSSESELPSHIKAAGSEPELPSKAKAATEPAAGMPQTESVPDTLSAEALARLAPDALESWLELQAEVQKRSASFQLAFSHFQSLASPILHAAEEAAAAAAMHGSGAKQEGRASLTPAGEGSTQQSSASEVRTSSGGLLSFMKEAERAAKHELSAEQERLLKSLNLTPEQSSVARTLWRSSRANSSDAATFLDSMLAMLNESALLGFKRRLRPSSVSGQRFDRASQLLQQEYLHRKSATGLSKTAQVPVMLYECDRTKTHSHTSQASSTVTGTPLDARLLSAMSQPSSSHSLATAPDSKATQTTATWSDITALKLEGGLVMTETATSKGKAQDESLLDDMLLALDSSAPFATRMLHRQPYKFDIRMRPPTFILDLMTDYLQVKYQDVFTRQDAVNRMQQLLFTDDVGRAMSQLSPPELDQINRQATQLFETGDVVGYSTLMTQLAQSGHLSPSELSSHLAVIQRRADELKYSCPSLATHTQQDTASAVTSKQQEALATFLTSGSSSAAASEDAATLAAKQLWETATKQGLASLGSEWSSALVRAALQGQQQRQGSQQGSVPAELQASVSSGEYCSWEQACKLWSSFLDAAGAPPTAPSLADVINTDQQLRTAKTSSAASSPAVQQAEAAAAALNEQLDAIYASYLERSCIPATFPTVFNSNSTRGHGTSDSASSMGSLSSSQLVSQQQQQQAAAFNAHLDVADASKLLDRFKGSMTVSQLLKSHWESVSRTYLKSSLAWSTAPAWEQIWSLMRSLYQQYSSSNTAPLHPTNGAATSALGSISTSSQIVSSMPTASLWQAAGGPGGDHNAAAGLLSMLGSDQDQAGKAAQQQGLQQQEEDQWHAYTTNKELAAGTATSSGPAWLPDQQMAPPYPGAKPIVRFTQCIVLGPASALSSTQNLAERVQVQAETHPAVAWEAGYKPPPVLLPDHPAARRVEMRVNVQELAEEVGLSKAALDHLIAIAGPKRYNGKTKELVVVGKQYASREENRRWCLECLHMLLQEAHKFQQQQQTDSSQAAASFLLTQPGVENMLGAR